MAATGMNRDMFFGSLAGLPAGDLLEIQKAYWLAKNAHRPQAPRDGGERYFEHPREVATLLIERHYGTRSAVIKALLHDVVEDTTTPPSIIVDIAGYQTWKSLLILAKYVPVFDPVTGRLIGRYRKTDEEYYGELAGADVEDGLVKLADRTRNMSTMDVWPKERRIKYARETEKWLLPIADVTDPWFANELRTMVEQELA